MRGSARIKQLMSRPFRRVLIVEDDPQAAKALAGLLRADGYEPVIFHDGQTALQYVRDHPTEIALIDIHLPDISGLDVSQQIRRRHGEGVTIIILSGDSDMVTLRSLPEAGATYFFSKPVIASNLLSLLKTCC